MLFTKDRNTNRQNKWRQKDRLTGSQTDRNADENIFKDDGQLKEFLKFEN